MKTSISTTFVLRIVVITAFCLLLSFLFILQIIHGQTYKEYAENNYVRKHIINAKRGEIFDRNGQPIVQNYPSVNLVTIPQFINNLDSLKIFLNTNFSISDTEVDSLLYEARFRRYKKNILIDNLSTEQIATIAENLNYYPSLSLEIGNTRKYQIANHFTGYIGRINSKEYKSLKNEGYDFNSYLGKTGIEKQYESYLKGSNGIGLTLVDAKGRDLKLFTDISNREDLIYKPAIDGMNINLTLDLNLQSHVDSLFKDNQQGAAIVIDYKTGEILAYVSKPSMDQNIFMSRISQDQWQSIQADTLKPFLDRVSNANYPPGSVFKIVSSGFGLDFDLVNRWTELSYCDGGMQIGDRYVKCWNHYGHGRLNVVEALKYSCDVYFYDLSMKINLDDFRYYVKDCMLTQKTGIDLPTEAKGFFPSEKWYKSTYGKYTSIKGHMVILSIGQGEVFVTPLQVCSLYGAVANNGVWKKPHLFKQASRNDEKLLYEEIESNTSVDLPFKDSTLPIIQEGLRAVVNENGGTARMLDFPGRHIYGKTGSAEHKKGRLTHGWFAGYDTDTGIAVVTFRQEAGHGGSVAVPIAKDIFEFYYNYLESKNDKK